MCQSRHILPWFQSMLVKNVPCVPKLYSRIIVLRRFSTLYRILALDSRSKGHYIYHSALSSRTKYKKTITRMTASCCQNQFGVSKPTRLEGDLFYVRYNSVRIKCPFKHFLSKVELNYLGQYENTMVTFKPYI